MREREEERDRRRERLDEQEEREREERHEWRERMRRVREYRNKRLRNALDNLREKHDRAARTYAYIASLLHSKLKKMKHSGQLALGRGLRGSRRLMEERGEEMRFIDMISRCKLVEIGDVRSFELCVHFNVGAEYYSLELKVRSDTNQKDSKVDYLDIIEATKHHFGDHQSRGHSPRDWSINPIASHLGYTMSRHNDGNDSRFNFVHYFDEYRFDYFGVSMDGPEECSQILDGLPFKMCLSTNESDSNRSDIELYFEKNENDEYDIDGVYSYQIKELVDGAFDKNVFRFNEDSDWDEIEVIDHNDGFQWTKKCNHRLLIATVCVERFDDNHHRASIKMRDSTQKRIISSADIIDAVL